MNPRWMAECCSKLNAYWLYLRHWGKKQRFIRWWIRHNAGHRFLSLVSDERKRRIWLTKAVQYASFYHASRRPALDAASDSVRPLTTNGCDELAWWRTGWKVKKWKSNAFWWPVPASRANTGRSRGLSEPASSAEVLPELTPCGDVGLVSAICRRWPMKVLLRYWWSPTYPSRVSGCRVMSGRNAAYVYHPAIASVTLDESGNGTFNWQMAHVIWRWQRRFNTHAQGPLVKLSGLYFLAMLNFFNLIVLKWSACDRIVIILYGMTLLFVKFTYWKKIYFYSWIIFLEAF